MTTEFVKGSAEVHTWQAAVRVIEGHVFQIRTPQGQGSGFHIGKFGDGLCAVATALHVVSVAADLFQPIKLIHAKTGKELLLQGGDRAIFPYPKSDIAIIVFKCPADLSVPTQHPDHIAAAEKIVAGVEVGWLGFPAVKSDSLSFFHGYISSVLESEERYLVDGVAINGVSGGPVVYIDQESKWPKIVGVITAYIPNKTNVDALPGVSMVSSIPAEYEQQITALKNLPQANKVVEEKAEEQKNAQSSDGVSQSPGTDGQS